MTNQQENLLSRLIATRRHIHQHPELSNEEFETTRYIKKWLEAENITIVDYGLKTGVIAEIGTPSSNRNEPVIALRADIDALPIEEETGLSFASHIQGKMHACGHDFHTAALLGAASILKQQEEELPGKVRLIFQPAEEKALGAKQLIDRGVLEQVDYIFGLHNKPDLPAHTVGINDGEMMAAADGFYVEVIGKGAHAATPELGIDPLVVSAHIITAVQTIVSRSISAREAAVISITRLNGGHAWNVIAEKAVFDGTIRTYHEATRIKVKQQFEKIVTQVAVAFGASATLKWLEGPPAVINESKAVNLLKRAGLKLNLDVEACEPSLAGEDFAYYLNEVKGAFLFLGTGQPYAWHHPKFDVDEAVLLTAARLLSEVSITTLQELYLEKAIV